MVRLIPARNVTAIAKDRKRDRTAEYRRWRLRFWYEQLKAGGLTHRAFSSEEWAELRQWIAVQSQRSV